MTANSVPPSANSVSQSDSSITPAKQTTDTTSKDTTSKDTVSKDAGSKSSSPAAPAKANPNSTGATRAPRSAATRNTRANPNSKPTTAQNSNQNSNTRATSAKSTTGSTTTSPTPTGSAKNSATSSDKSASTGATNQNTRQTNRAPRRNPNARAPAPTSTQPSNGQSSNAVTQWIDPEAQQEAARYINPIPSRTLIEKTLVDKKFPLTHAALVHEFALTEPDAIQALDRRLKAMVRDHQLIASDDYLPEYRIIQQSDLLTGRVRIFPNGNGIVTAEDGTELALNERELSMVFNGDTVQARTSGSDRRGKLMGKIVNVLKRNQAEFIGKIAKDGNEWSIKLVNNQHQPIAMEPEQISAAKLNEGDYAKIKIDEWPTRTEYANAHIVEPLGNHVDTQLIIPSTLLDFDIPHVFAPETMNQVAKYKEPAAKDIKGRTDLRNMPLVTIDGDDSRDFDDAVYAEKRPGGGYRLVVAIADVSHYVQPQTSLDNDAIDRGTSVYFPHHVVPMLPEALSNELCSLKPNVDRLAMVADMSVSRQGNVTSYEFYPAVIHSHARLTYGQVADYLKGDKANVPDNNGVHKSLDVLNTMYLTLLERRNERKAMEFDTTETYMTFDDHGAITQIKPRNRNDAHRLIEESMLLANVSAADYALKNDLPVLFRNHEAPDLTKVTKVREYLKSLGLDFPEKPTQADYQHLMESISHRPDAETIHTLLLRSMMQAFYGSDNLGHYGLAYDSYTHFTSPIRRYPDLLLHRAIRSHIEGKKQPLTQTELEKMGEQTSMTERRADDAARQVSSWLKCNYMSQHLGEDYKGRITAVTEFGVFVTLNDLYVDGLIHIRNLGDDFFIYDPATLSLTGQNKGQKFSLGDSVDVKVAGVNMDERKIDFELLAHQSQKARANQNKPDLVIGTTMPTNEKGSTKTANQSNKPANQSAQSTSAKTGSTAAGNQPNAARNRSNAGNPNQARSRNPNTRGANTAANSVKPNTTQPVTAQTVAAQNEVSTTAAVTPNNTKAANPNTRSTSRPSRARSNTPATSNTRANPSTNAKAPSNNGNTANTNANSNSTNPATRSQPTATAANKPSTTVNGTTANSTTANKPSNAASNNASNTSNRSNTTKSVNTSANTKPSVNTVSSTSSSDTNEDTIPMSKQPLKATASTSAAKTPNAAKTQAAKKSSTSSKDDKKQTKKMPSATKVSTSGKAVTSGKSAPNKAAKPASASKPTTKKDVSKTKDSKAKDGHSKSKDNKAKAKEDHAKLKDHKSKDHDKKHDKDHKKKDEKKSKSKKSDK